MLMRRSLAGARPHFEMNHFKGVRYQTKFNWRFWKPVDTMDGPVYFGWYVEWDEATAKTVTTKATAATTIRRGDAVYVSSSQKLVSNLSLLTPMSNQTAK